MNKETGVVTFWTDAEVEYAVTPTGMSHEIKMELPTEGLNELYFLKYSSSSAYKDRDGSTKYVNVGFSGKLTQEQINTLARVFAKYAD